jgi:hypothetical protein
MYRFDHRPGEQGGEVAVHMVRNGRVHPLLCASHPAKTELCLPNYLFRDEAFHEDMFLKGSHVRKLYCGG